MAVATRTDQPAAGVDAAHKSLLLVGNPNAGKTTLFNRLTGLRLKTANFPGTTLDLRQGITDLEGERHRLVDLPGLYSLDAAASEERVALEAILAQKADGIDPGAVILIVDATNLVRNLYLASQVLELGLPTVVALNMVDLARKANIQIDTEVLSNHLSCPVVPIAARSGEGLPELRRVCLDALHHGKAPAPPRLLRAEGDGVSRARRYDWAESVAEACQTMPEHRLGAKTELADRFLTHPVAGMLAFFAVLFGVFYLIFSFATVPMDWIDGTVGTFGAWLGGVLPEGQLNSLIVDGVIAGVGGVLVFLPQICILFFCISLLEDTGYLARAACVMDRVLRRVGLPGKAFVPMLSAHACAIPAIMSARVIENKHDRLVTILVLPLMTCSARLPVYAMVTALLFPTRPMLGALAFTGAYGLGLGAAMSMAFIFRQALVRTPVAPLAIELPQYKLPGVKTALLSAYDRGLVFVKKAGTVILAISIVLWFLMSYPRADVPAAAAPDITAGVSAEEWAAQEQLRYSFAGRMGRVIEPVIEPLGFDWRIGVGIVASFAAREVVVSALSVIFGVGDAGAEQGSVLLDRLKEAVLPDGSPLFTTATAFSLLVFYVLAMQCLPTQVITRRETGSWKWALFQLGYMTLLAYFAALITFQGLRAFGLA